MKMERGKASFPGCLLKGNGAVVAEREYVSSVVNQRAGLQSGNKGCSLRRVASAWFNSHVLILQLPEARQTSAVAVPFWIERPFPDSIEGHNLVGG